MRQVRDERTPLITKVEDLAGDAKDSVETATAAGSSESATLTMLNAAVGVGVLSLPLAFKEAGLLLGLALLFVCGFLSYNSLRLLVVASEEEGVRSYRSLAQRCYGEWFSKVTLLLLTLQLLMSAAGTLVVFCDIWPTLLSAMGVHHAAPHDEHSSSGSSVAAQQQGQPWYVNPMLPVAALLLVIVLPLASRKDVSALRFTAALAFLFEVLLLIMVMIEHFRLCTHSWEEFRFGGAENSTLSSSKGRGEEDKGEYGVQQAPLCFPQALTDAAVLLPEADTREGITRNLLRAFPLILFAFTAQPNVLPIYDEMDRPKQMLFSVLPHFLTITLLLYTPIASFAFLTFRHDTKGNMLRNEFEHSDLFIVTAAGFSLALILTLPIMLQTARWNINGIFSPYNVSRPEQYRSIRIGLTALLCIVCAAVALTVPSLSTLVGLCGALLDSAVCYIIPAIFFLNFVPGAFYRRQRAVAMIILAIIPALSLASFAVILRDFRKGHVI